MLTFRVIWNIFITGDMKSPRAEPCLYILENQFARKEKERLYDYVV